MNFADNCMSILSFSWSIAISLIGTHVTRLLLPWLEHGMTVSHISCPLSASNFHRLKSSQRCTFAQASSCRFEEISCACWLSLWLQRIALPRSQTNLLHLLLCPHQNLKKHENPWLPNPLNLWEHKHLKLSVSPTIGILNGSVITLLHAVDNPPAPGILISQGPTHFRTSW